jgi:hypothetical protein
LLARAAALFCAILLLCISTPQGHPAASGGGSDEDVWQGTVTVVNEGHEDIDKTENTPPQPGCSGSHRHVSHFKDRKTTTYSDFHLLQPGGPGTTYWRGTARANASYSGTLYQLDVGKEGPCYKEPPRYHEEGYETTNSGSAVGQGEVEFHRSIDSHSGKATCGINATAEHELGKTQEVGRKWFVNIPGEKWENPVKQERSLLAGIAYISFDCAPYAKSYSGQRRIQNPDGTSIDTYTWNVHGALPETEVELIPPADYDQWEPQAGEDESTLGNFIDVQIVAHKKGDPNADPPMKVMKYTIELEDTSREKGVDLNWPPKEKAKDDFDMKIDPDNPWISVTDGKNAQKAETKQEGLTQFMVTVNSYDWGGYTKLHVTAELEDGSSVVGHVRGHPDQDFLLIPKDDNLNHIADWWEHWFDIKNRDASADDDDQPHSDAGKGDSIALYDEYRGFHIQGRHERLSPEIKDLFVWDPHRLGVGIYGVTGIHVHVISDDEFASKLGANNTNVVTPNGSHGDVYAILLTKGSIEAGVVGDTVGGPGVPRDIRKVVIDPDLIARAYGDYAAAELQSTIAHELSHATNVWHHDGEPPPDYDIGEARCQVPDESGRPGTEGTKVTVNLPCNKMPRDKNGKAIGPGQPAFDCFEVAAKGGKYSGNDQCWMRYDMTNFYEDKDGNCQWQHNGKTVKGSKYGMDPPGMTMCESPDGTGVNDPTKKPDKAGNATRGNCKNQLRLK